MGSTVTQDVIVECPACGGTAFEHAFRTADRHYGIDGTWNIDKCVACNLLFLNPMPSQDELDAFYPDGYYAALPGPAPGNSLRSRLVRRLYPPVGDPAFLKPGRMLDVGSGSGDALTRFRALGWEAIGVEPNRAACEAGRDRGLDIRQGSVIDAGFPDGHFDYVRSNHSFEHVRNPTATLREIRRIMKPGGALLIGVPNTNGAAAKLFGAYWYFLGAPLHTFGYQPNNLRLMLAKSGLTVVHVRHNSNFRGTVGSLQIRLNGRSGRPSDRGFLANKPGPKLAGQMVARGLDLVRHGDCIEVLARRD